MDKFYKILRIIFMIVVLLSICSRAFAVGEYNDYYIYNQDYSIRNQYILNNYEYYCICSYTCTFNNRTNACFEVVGSHYPFYLYNATTGKAPVFFATDGVNGHQPYSFQFYTAINRLANATTSINYVVNQFNNNTFDFTASTSTVFNDQRLGER